MSEAELYWMRLRLQGGKLSKARRGALHLTPPVGYEWVRRQPVGRQGRPRQQERRADGLYSLHGIAALLDVTEPVVRSWVEKGWLRYVEGGGRGSPR